MFVREKSQVDNNNGDDKPRERGREREKEKREERKSRVKIQRWERIQRRQGMSTKGKKRCK